MNDFSTLGSKILVLLIVGGLILSSGCDMGTYGRRMKDKAKPIESDANQVPANGGTAADQDNDSTDE
jgi:hypothetical protein